ncbi:hypothetical protein FJ872_30780 [Mesorhizobium sp. B2-5-9]|uniref:hypothetical protein n=1 Tax=Mesorhizobium sp. B2-5-9 TaxID=2589921 RepID=UPI00112AC62F|nr:hypothetical protein [Mesorhizobium sp. B2-5-9]TPJ99497.1 hypothetical protein FJ872_30780 [Mesorhizobium sp. B2-5-9]
MIRVIGKKAKRKAEQAVIALPLDDEVQTEAAHYARKGGIKPPPATEFPLGSENVLSARAALGPEWQKKMNETVVTCSNS